MCFTMCFIVWDDLCVHSVFIVGDNAFTNWFTVWDDVCVCVCVCVCVYV